MDNNPYKAVSDLYRFLNEKQGILDKSDVAYMTGVLKTLSDLYAEPPVEPEKPGLLDSIIRRKQ